jgi:hypothetical protein
MRSKMFHSRMRAPEPSMPRKPDLRVCADHADLSRRAAEAAVGTINDALRTAGTCSMVLAGGSTPRRLYSLLATEFRSQIPWVNVQVFWGDERYVPPEDTRSNFRVAKETLRDHVPCPPANIHPMPTHFSTADEAAARLRADAKEPLRRGVASLRSRSAWYWRRWPHGITLPGVAGLDREDAVGCGGTGPSRAARAPDADVAGVDTGACRLCPCRRRDRGRSASARTRRGG